MREHRVGEVAGNQILLGFAGRGRSGVIPSVMGSPWRTSSRA